MPQSLACLHAHLVFSTKHRQPWITENIRESLHAYIGTLLVERSCAPALVNSVADHAHILFNLPRALAPCDVVEDVKKHSSRWIKTQGGEFASFAWQGGYGMFSVSESKVDDVRRYIGMQREHHRGKSFQEEFRMFLQRHNIPYDERYVWD